MIAPISSKVVAALTICGGVLLSGCDTRCVGPACPDSNYEGFSWPEDEEEEGDGAVEGAERGEELTAVRSKNIKRWHKPPANTGTVAIAGSFNNWEPAEMEGPDDGGWFSIDLGELTPGTYAYKYVYNGQWESSVPNTGELQWSDGVENRLLRVGDTSKPLLRVQQATASADGDLEVVVKYALGHGGSPISTNNIQVTVGDGTGTIDHDKEGQLIRITKSGLSKGKHSVKVSVKDDAGNDGDNSTFTPLWVEDQAFEWTDGPMYLVFTDRFRNGDGKTDAISGVPERANYQGGDFKGILDALNEGYFTDLGIRSIWLSPLYQNPDAGFQGQADNNLYAGYHGYWPTQAREVEDRYGDDQKSADARLREVIAKAHEQGIRIVMDVVLNHVHDEHHYINEFPDWFVPGCVCGAPGCGWEEKPIECKFTPYMPDLDHTIPSVTEQMLEDTLWWLEEYDIDGLRIDAVKHFHRVMTVNLRHRLRDTIEVGGGAKVYQVGETFTGAWAQGELVERIGENEMDAQFDFPIYWIIRQTFADGGSMTSLEDAMKAGQAAWGNAPMSPFAGNHDIPRLATAVAKNDDGPWGNTVDRMWSGGDTVTEWDMVGNIANALGYTLTLPGVPLLYYGDEIGLAGAGDPDNRRSMNFAPNLTANQATLLEKVQRVGQARQEIRALQRGEWTALWAEQDMTAFARHTEDSVAFVIVSRGAARTTDIPVQGLAAEGLQLKDRMNDGRATNVVDGRIRVQMGGGNDIAILAP